MSPPTFCRGDRVRLRESLFKLGTAATICGTVRRRRLPTGMVEILYDDGRPGQAPPVYLRHLSAVELLAEFA
jgi:hypothetical protein